MCYYQNTKSLSASLLTALTNRVGDVLILVGIALVVNEGTWHMYSYRPSIYIAGLRGFLVVAGITKRAQMPFCA